MLNISGFLGKFKKFGEDKTSQKENIKKNIEKVLGISVPSENLVIKDKVLYIQGSPSLKQEIFLKKEQVLSCLAQDGVYGIR